MRHYILPALLFPCLATGFVQAATAPPTPGTPTTQCQTCHGERGVSVSSDVPHLDGQTTPYLVESMELLRTKGRRSAIADHIPSDWDSKRMLDVARFYSASSGHRDPEKTDPEKVRRGNELFHDRCEVCHDSDGRESDSRGAGSPIIAGQRIDYLIGQIRAYVTGERPSFVGVKDQSFQGQPLTVRGVSVREGGSKITESDGEAIAHFLASVPRTSKTGRRARLQ